MHNIIIIPKLCKRIWRGECKMNALYNGHIEYRTFFTPSLFLYFYAIYSQYYSQLVIFFLLFSINKAKLPIELCCNGVVICNYYLLEMALPGHSSGFKNKSGQYMHRCSHCTSHTYIPHRLGVSRPKMIILNEHLSII